MRRSGSSSGVEARRLLVEAGRVQRRAAEPGVLGRVGQGLRDGLVRTGGRLREVAGPGIRGRRRGGERGVGGAELVGVGEARDALREQRMGEPDDAPVDLDEPVVHGGPDVVAEPGRGPLERVHRRLRGGRGEQQGPARGSRQQRDPAPDQRPEAVRQRERLVRIVRVARPHERSTELEGVERVAARRGLDPDEDQARERPPELARGTAGAAPPGASDRRGCAAFDPASPRPGSRPTPASRRRSARPRAGRPVDRVSRRSAYARIAAELSSTHWASSIASSTGPLALGQLAEDPGTRDGQRALVGRRVGRRVRRLHAQQRDPERTPLGAGQPGERVVVHPAQQVGQPAEREPRLRPARAASTGRATRGPGRRRRPPPRRSTSRCRRRPRARGHAARWRRLGGAARPRPAHGHDR